MKMLKLNLEKTEEKAALSNKNFKEKEKENVVSNKQK